MRHPGAGTTGVPALEGCPQHASTSTTAPPATPPQPRAEVSPWTASRGAGLSLPRVGERAGRARRGEALPA